MVVAQLAAGCTSWRNSEGARAGVCVGAYRDHQEAARESRLDWARRQAT